MMDYSLSNERYIKKKEKQRKSYFAKKRARFIVASTTEIDPKIAQETYFNLIKEVKNITSENERKTIELLKRVNDYK